MLTEQNNPSSQALSLRLFSLAQDLDSKIVLGNLSTADEIMGVMNELLWEFYEQLRVPYTSRLVIRPGDRLTPSVLVSVLNAVTKDLNQSYNKISDAQDEISRRMNRYLIMMRDTQERIGHANSITASINRVLENDTYEIADSFNDRSLIDPNAEGGLFLNQDAGLLTLPQAGSTRLTIAKTDILGSSNGDEDPDHPLGNLVDGNLDTWFEYSKDADLDDSPLIFEVLLTLRTVAIINQLQIFPLLLDDRSFPRVLDISTSLDGRIYETIRSSLPVFLTKDEEDSLLTIGPVGFRNQNIADFTFLPRTCQFIRIKLQQGKKVTEGGKQLLRMGFQDIAVNQLEYEESGTIQSLTFPLEFTPRKIKLVQRAVATDPLTTLTYQVSLDAGAQWFDIIAGQNVEINTGNPNSIEVIGDPTNIKLKILAARDRGRFSGLAKPLARTLKTISRLFQVPSAPAELTVENVPIEGSVMLLRPVLAVGKSKQFNFPLVDAHGEPDLSVSLPVNIAPFTETIRVNGQAWTRVRDLTIGRPDDRWYTIDYANRTLQFGDGVTNFLANGPITIDLEAERVLLPDTSPLTVDLNYGHDFNPESVEVLWYDRARQTREEGLARGTTKFQIENTPIVQSLDVEEDVPPSVNSFFLANIPRMNAEILFSDQVVFANLVEELADPGDFTITQLTSGLISPVKITTVTKTHADFPGTVQFESIAKILQPQLTYFSDQWQRDIGVPTLSNLTKKINPFYPRFSDTAVFANEVTFGDGVTELKTAGDYSIDYANGTIYSFSRTNEQGVDHVIYTYQKHRPLNWEFVSGVPTQLTINDDSFLVNKNDQFAAVLTEKHQANFYLTYKDNRYIRVSVSGVSPVFDTGVRIDYADEDLVHGLTLPARQTRVRLPHESIVKNSVRFVFASDDINAFDDRIVTKNIRGSISVLPKPIKDVYGNALDGARVGSKTQRDVDKLTLVRERIFQDGRKELEKEGDYSLDYRKGILYTYTPIPAHTIIQYEYADIRVSYIATIPLLEGSQFEFALDELKIKINSLGGIADLTGAPLLVRYDIVDQLREDPVRIFRFFSPILYGYALKVKP